MAFGFDHIDEDAARYAEVDADAQRDRRDEERMEAGDTTMTEYTPTIDYLRETWVLDQMEDSMVRRAEAEASFDRALAAHDAEVAANAWDEGAKWGALQVAGLPDSDPDYVQIKAGANPYRGDRKSSPDLGNRGEDSRG